MFEGILEFILWIFHIQGRGRGISDLSGKEERGKKGGVRFNWEWMMMIYYTLTPAEQLTEGFFGIM